MGQPLIDFSILGNLGNDFREGRRRATRDEILASAPTDGSPQSLATLGMRLLQAGDTEGGATLANLAHRQYLASPEYITKSETAKAEVAEKFAPKTAEITLPSGEKVTVQKGPNGYVLPKVEGLPAPDPNAPQPPPGVDVKKWREARATQLGNIDDKAVLEADKAVEAGTNAVQSLGRAIELSKNAHSGPLAGKIGYVGSLFGHQPSINTELLSSTVTNQALENLRATFGGNPTEGERKILLDVQGAVNQAPAVREQIYQNALEAANRRIAFNKQNAEQMRSGKYLLPEGQRSAQPPAAAAPATAPQPAPAAPTGPSKEAIAAARANPGQAMAQAREAIKRGADPNAVMQELRLMLGAQSEPPPGNVNASGLY